MAKFKIQGDLVIKDKGSKKMKDFGKTTEKSMKKASKATGGLSKSMSKLSIAAAAVVAVKLAKWVLDTTVKMAKLGDEIAKTSKRLGVTTEGLQFLQFVADRAGASVVNLTMNIQRMARRVAEAAVGQGEAVDAIKELGLNVNKLAAQKPDKTFIDIMDAMGKLDSEAGKFRVGFKIFGLAFGEVMQIMRDSGGDLTKLKEKFLELGGGIDTGFILKSEAFQDAIAHLSTAWKKFASEALEPMVVMLTTIFDLMTKIMRMKADPAFNPEADISPYTKAQLGLGGTTYGAEPGLPMPGIITPDPVERKAIAAEKAAKEKARIAKLTAEATKKWNIMETKRMDAALRAENEIDEETIQWVENYMKANDKLGDSWSDFGKNITDTGTKMTTFFDTYKDQIDDVGSAFQSNMVDNWTAYTEGTKTAGDALRDFASGFAKEINRMIAKLIALWIWEQITGMVIGAAAGGTTTQGTGAGGAGGTIWAHAGGVVGRSGTTKPIDPSVFIGAPRLHQGLASDEFPAILQRGETVIPRGGSTTSNLQITNNVNVNRGQGDDTSSVEDYKMAKRISDMLEDRMKKTLSKQMSPGGILNRQQMGVY
jgi:hypothetical protein